jgi:molybdopterin-binding protein
MKLSARNQLKGKITEIRDGAVNGIVVVDVGGQKVFSSITMDSIKSMGLKPGMEVYAVIKASSVMIGVD